MMVVANMIDEVHNKEHPQVGELALTVAKMMDTVEFKTPLPPKKLKTRKIKVLDEDTYLQEIDRIIQRDFFPDVEKLKTQNDYLDAVKHNDVYRLQEIYSKYSLENTPLSMPGSFRSRLETPLLPNESSILPDSMNASILPDSMNASIRSSFSSISTQNEKKIDKDKSLDAFLSSHTSEDNQSFEELIEEQKQVLRIKQPWLFKEDDAELMKITNGSSLPLADVPEQLMIEDSSKQRELDSWGYKDRNYIMFIPDGVELSKEKKIEMAANKRKIAHENTRLFSSPFDEQHNKETLSEIAQKQLRVLKGKIGIDGKEIISDTPKINGFSFVKSPSPMPGVDATPLMTWGQIEGTPFRLDGSDTPKSISGPKFKIAEQPKREKLALALAEEVTEKYRKRKKNELEAAKRQLSMSSLNKGSPIDCFNSMSPAAQKLARSHLRSPYSPSYLTSPKTPFGKFKHIPTASITPGLIFQKTPIKMDKTSVKKSSISAPKQRAKAADFFK